MLAACLVTCLYGSFFSDGEADGATLTPLSTQTTSNTPGVGLRTPWGVGDFLLLYTYVEGDR